MARLYFSPFDADGQFRSSSDQQGLRRVAVRGAGATLLSSMAAIAIQAVSIVILARLLSPRDFGVVTMVTTVSLLLMNFGVNGFTEAVIQRAELDRTLASNLFWINFGIGTLLSLGFAATGPLLARFFQEPLVSSVTVGMSLTIVLTSTSVLHVALLKRSMRFTVASANDLLARGVGIAVSVLLAWLGWGYWALVAGAVSQAFSQSAGAWLVCRWIPNLPARHPGTMSMVKFALSVYGRFGANYLARNADNVLVGWRFNSVTLGFYKKAYDLFAFSSTAFVSSLSNVAVAALSRLNRDKIRFRQTLLNLLTLSSFVGMGVGGTLTLIGADVVRLLLGPKWAPAGEIFTFFGPGVGIMLLYGVHGWIHLSIGRADRWFRWGLIECAFTVLLFLLALPWGPNAVALAWTVSFWVLAIPAFWYATEPIGLTIRSVLGVIWKFPAASLLAGGSVVRLMRSYGALLAGSNTLEILSRLLIVSAAFWLCYLGAVSALHRGFHPLALVARLLGEFRSRGQSEVGYRSPALKEAAESRGEKRSSSA